MARIRSIKPEFWDDRKLAKRTTPTARLLYIALWNLADEHARLNGDPQWIKGQVFSYDDDIDAAYIAKLLDELKAPALGAVIAYEVDGDPYLFLPKLDRHQRLEPEKVKSRLPAPPVTRIPDPDDSPPTGDPSEPRADSSARGADQSESGADDSARGADGSRSGADKPALLYVAGSMEHGAGGRGSRTGVREEPPRTVLANTLLDEHTRQITPRPPRDVTRRTGEQIDKLLDDSGIKPDEITQALALLRAKPNAGPGLLPDLVHEVRQRNANGNRASPRRSHRPYQDPPDESAYEEPF